MEFYRGDLSAASILVEEALECFRTAGERGGEAWALQNLALFAFLRGSPRRASTYLDAATTVFEELGDWGGLAWSRGLRAWLLFSDGDLDGAEALAGRATSEDSQIGDRFGGAMNETLLASIALWRGNMARCIDQASAAVDQFAAIGDAWGEATALRVAGRARLARGEIERTLDDLARVRKLDASRGAARTEGFTDDFGVLVLALIGRPEQVLEELTDDQQTSESLHSGLASAERFQATALVHLQVGQPDEAVAVLRRVADSAPTPRAAPRSIRSWYSLCWPAARSIRRRRSSLCRVTVQAVRTGTISISRSPRHAWPWPNATRPGRRRPAGGRSTSSDRRTPMPSRH
ncbi:MAG: hypothetical protein M5U31_09855 [Acidimicrobiia bacterium]|nr:hypothetical protein [Acidimicrobiia bacterium]